jgi:hypothetical protein
LTRAFALAAVVAVSSAFAAPAGSQSTVDEPQGVAVPGLEAAKVSGEAFGGRVTALFSGVELLASAAASGPTSTGTPGFMKDFLEALGVHVAVGTLEIRAEAGPDPEVELPATGGGPLQDEDESLTLRYSDGHSLVIAKDLAVTTQGAIGATGYAHTESDLSDVIGAFMFAEKIDTECDADLTGVRGSTEFDDGLYASDDLSGIGKISQHPEPNEELADFEFDELISPTELVHVSYSLVVNEQDKDDHAITVTGVHERFSATLTDPTNPSAPPVEVESAETRYGRSHCDIEPVAAAPVVEPTFTG